MKNKRIERLFSILKSIAINLSLVALSFMLGLWGVNAALIQMKFPAETYVPEICKNNNEQISFTYTQSLTNAFYPSNSELPVCTRDFFVVNHSDNFGYLGYGQSEIPKGNSLLVFGDSFAYGYGVPQDKSFAAIMGAYNAGLWGNTYPQHLRVFKRVVGKMKIQRAYWVVYPPHVITATNNGWMTSTNITQAEHPWLYELLGYFNKTQLSTALLATTGIGFNRGDSFTPEWRLFNIDSKRHEEGYSSFQDSAASLARIAKENNVELIIIFMPSKQQMMLEINNKRPLFVGGNEKVDAEWPVKRLSKTLVERGIPLEKQINLLPYFAKQNWKNLYFQHDAHLNENGNRLVAEILLQARQNLGRNLRE